MPQHVGLGRRLRRSDPLSDARLFVRRARRPSGKCSCSLWCLLWSRGWSRSALVRGRSLVVDRSGLQTLLLRSQPAAAVYGTQLTTECRRIGPGPREPRIVDVHPTGILKVNGPNHNDRFRFLNSMHASACTWIYTTLQASQKTLEKNCVFWLHKIASGARMQRLRT